MKRIQRLLEGASERFKLFLSPSELLGPIRFDSDCFRNRRSHKRQHTRPQRWGQVGPCRNDRRQLGIGRRSGVCRGGGDGFESESLESAPDFAPLSLEPPVFALYSEGVRVQYRPLCRASMATGGTKVVRNRRLATRVRCGGFLITFTSTRSFPMRLAVDHR